MERIVEVWNSMTIDEQMICGVLAVGAVSFTCMYVGFIFSGRGD